MTLRLGIIGYPLGHSASPAFQQAALDHLGLDATYERWEVEPERLAERVRELRGPDLLGFSVTVPHKETVMPLLDEVDPAARDIGAVNTVVHSDGRLLGARTPTSRDSSGPCATTATTSPAAAARWCLARAAQLAPSRSRCWPRAQPASPSRTGRRSEPAPSPTSWLHPLPGASRRPRARRRSPGPAARRGRIHRPPGQLHLPGHGPRPGLRRLSRPRRPDTQNSPRLRPGVQPGGDAAARCRPARRRSHPRRAAHARVPGRGRLPHVDGPRSALSTS